MTDLDQLKALWTENDRKLDLSIRLNQRLLHDVAIRPARSAMGWLTASLIFESTVMLATIVLLGSFIGDTIATPRFAVPAAMLNAMAIGFFWILIRQIVVAREIDYSLPIATIQKRLETLRVLRIRYTQGLLIVAVLAWPPLLVVLLKALFGLDAYAMFGWTYIWANVVVGLAAIPIAIWVSQRLERASPTSPVLGHLLRTISGSSLCAAMDSLAKLSAFEDESV